jgi:hypothetical protein
MKWLFALALAGCGVDLCGYADFKTNTCVTVHLSGQLNTGVKDIDTLQADVTYSISGLKQGRRVDPSRISTGTAPSALPIAFGVVYPDSAQISSFSSDFRVLLLKDGTPVGYGHKEWGLEVVKTGEHGHFPLEIKPIMTGDHCFDGIRDLGEGDADCGSSDCPLCATGRTCISDSDCLSGDCMFVSGGDDICR